MRNLPTITRIKKAISLLLRGNVKKEANNCQDSHSNVEKHQTLVDIGHFSVTSLLFRSDVQKEAQDGQYSSSNIKKHQALINSCHSSLTSLDRFRAIIRNRKENIKPEKTVKSDVGPNFGAPGSKSLRISEPKVILDRSNQYLANSLNWNVVNFTNFKLPKCSTLVKLGKVFLAILLANQLATGIWQLASSRAYAATGIYKQINFQGRLTDASSNLLTGTYYLCFSIYDDVSAGSKLWPAGTPAPTTVSATNGVFSTTIGSADALTLDFNRDDYYLLVYVNSSSSCTVGGENLTPRQRVTSAGYAFNADTVDGIHAATSATPNQVLALDSDKDLELGTGDVNATNSTLQGTLQVTGGYMSLGGSTPTSGVGILDSQNNATAQYQYTGDNSAIFDIYGSADADSTLSLVNSRASRAVAVDIDGDLMVGAATLTAPFSVDESANTVRIGEAANGDATLNMYSASGATGSIVYSQNDAWGFINGNVGIGTTAPKDVLGVSGSASFGSLPTTALPQANSAYFSGNVGIGTTNPVTTLEVRGTIENGLMAWWPLDDDADDKSIGGHNGSLESSACPSGYILVPGDVTYSTSDFCVMQYEAKNVGGVATSQAGTTPWASITQTAAATACTSAGGHLITNNEWMTIARNVEQVAGNWTGGVGTGCMYRGNTGTDDACGYNGSDPEYGTGRNSKASLALDNGQVIWDLAGNVWEWTNNTISCAAASCTTDEMPYDANPGSEWVEFPYISTYGQLSYDQIRPSISSWNSGYGMGQLYSDADAASPSGNVHAFRRGGCWGNGAYAGGFALSLGDAPASSGTYIGFRCVR